MASGTSQRPDDIDLRSLWHAAIGSLPRLFVLALILASATYGVLFMIAPRYVSETQLTIASMATNNPFADPRATPNDSVTVRMDKEAVNTHVRALMSTDLGEEIVREMNLADLPEFNSARGSPDMLSALLRRVGIGAPRMSQSDQDRALTAYFDRLEVYSPKESRFIGVRFASQDPNLAAAVANRIAERYRDNLARQSLSDTDEVQKALAPKIAKLAEEAATAEEEVEKFRGQANIFKGGQQATGLNEQQLAELNAELSKVKAARSEAEARAKQAREMQDLGSAETLADVQKSPLIQNLVQSRVRVERQISELSATLLSGHPRMRQLAADLKGLKVQIASEVAKIVDGIGKEAKVAALREEAIQKSVNEIKNRIVDLGPDEAKLRSLEADAKSKRAELDRLRAQFEANRVRADDRRAIPVEAQIVSSARPSSVPVFPRKGATSLMVAVATMLIGLAFVITRGLLTDARVPVSGGAHHRNRRAFPTLPDIPARAPEREATQAAAPPRRGMRQPDMPAPADAHVQADTRAQTEDRKPAAVPSRSPAPAPAKQGQAQGKPQGQTQSQPQSKAQSQAPVAAQPPVSGKSPLPAQSPPAGVEITTPDALAARLEALRKGGLSGARTLFTGAADVFSLANEAAALCRSLADRGSTVIMIDWTLNGSGIAEPLGQPAWPGFSELIENKTRFEDVVRPLRDSDVHLIPSGRSINVTGEPLDADSINFLLDALDDVYEHIVVVSRNDPARQLFEAIQGRFDCGVTLVENREQASAVRADAGTFLGFEVDGITLLTLDRSTGPVDQTQRAAKRKDRLTRVTA